MAQLPDLFAFNDGSRVRKPEDWPRRRAEILDAVLGTGYGHLPPAPERVVGEPLITQTVARFGDARHSQYRIVCDLERPVSFLLDLIIPAGTGRFPVVVNGDACWLRMSEEIMAEVVSRGYILARFNRVELAPDLRSDRTTGLYRAWPRGEYGALAAWAWGYHRCVDFLRGFESADGERIAITGHSRGGKTVLLAGATDERIALTVPNNSGCGGAGCFRSQGPGSETLADILRNFPFWFSPRLASYVGREDGLPFDQHGLKALVAPRALLSTEALGDLWANPSGSLQTHLAAKEVYRFLGAEERIGIGFREGGHDHNLNDWKVMLDFADARLRGKEIRARFEGNPFPDMPRAFDWTAPR